MRSTIFATLLLALVAVAQVQAGMNGHGGGNGGCGDLSGNLLSACNNCGGDSSCEDCVSGVDAAGLVNAVNTASRCQGSSEMTQACIVIVATAAPGTDPVVYIDRCDDIICPAQAECLATVAAAGGTATEADECLSADCEPVPPFGYNFPVCKYFRLPCPKCRSEGKDAELCISCFQGAYSAVSWRYRLGALIRAYPTCINIH